MTVLFCLNYDYIFNFKPKCLQIVSTCCHAKEAPLHRNFSAQKHLLNDRHTSGLSNMTCSYYIYANFIKKNGCSKYNIIQSKQENDRIW